MTRRETRPLTRRRLLAGLGTAIGSLALAGCTDDADTAPDDGDDSGTGEDSTDADGDDSTGADDGDDSSEGGRDDSDGETDSGSDCAGESVHEGYDERALTITTPDGELLGSVTAAIADSRDTQVTGLSETECLPPDRGMLFLYDQSQRLGFWMRDMDFGIDIIYIDAEGVITSIHHAERPAEDEDGTEEHHQYVGEGRYVLEVNLGWTTERGIEAGDIVALDS